MSYAIVDGQPKIYNPLTGEYRDVVPEVKKEVKVEAKTEVVEAKTEKKK